MSRAPLLAPVVAILAALLLTSVPVVPAQTCTGLGPVSFCIDESSVLSDPSVLHVGILGVEERVAYAAAEGGLVVAAGVPVRILADFAFEESSLVAGETLHHVAILRLVPPQGQPFTAVAWNATSTGPSFTRNGTLEVTWDAPEVLAEGWSVFLEAHVRRATTSPQTNVLLSSAFSSAPLSVVAAPAPLDYVAGLRMGPTVHLGSASADLTTASADLEDGLTVIAAGSHVTFTATASASRAAVAGTFNYVSMMAYATFFVGVPGGPSYGQSIALIEDQCTDWATASCSLDAASGATEFSIPLPISALRGKTDVNANIHISYEFMAQDDSWQTVGAWHSENANTRVVVLAGLGP